MKHFNLLKSSLLVILSLCLSQCWSQETTFDYTGAVQTYTVPDGVSEISIVAFGAQGGSAGGLGARIEGSFVVTGGEVLTVIVGEEGHLQLGGNDQNSAGGGGGSFVYDEAAVLFVAAGGGGGKCPYLGAVPLHPDCHGQVGEDGGENSDGTSAGGVGGNGGEVGLWGGTDCGGGGTGWLSNGGGILMGGKNAPTWVGGDPYCDGGGGGCGGIGGFGGGGGAGNLYGGGGGGGGYSGGAGGNDPDHGGGGGSFNSGFDPIDEGGVHAGHGQVIITVLCNALTITASEEAICIGQEVTLTAVSDVGGEITWEGDIENGLPFIPDELGLVEFTVSSDGEGDCDGSIIIAIWNYPDVEIEYDGPDPICFGDEITLSGDGATDYEWELDVVDGDPFIPEVGITDYTVIGTSGPGCQDIESITIEVFEAADIGASVTDDEACFGQSITLTGDGGETYIWSPEEIEDGVSFTPTDAGTYTYYVIGTDANGCTDQDSVEVFINEEIIITYTTIEEVLGGDGSIDITVSGGSPPYTFDWDNDGTGDWDDTEDLIDIAGGSYIVIVRDEITCTGSETIALGSQASVDKNQEVELSIFPNPTNQWVTIQYEGIFRYELITLNGDLISTGTAVDLQMINLEENANGIYFINVISDYGIKTIKLVRL
ncbi:MAG: T9SS type A sorting domain-containing protein [Crocinitomix sp.]|nr:T9SS type A sorting domain-containing protein [Crocinitomix sp.]